jgi:hypothetical protein
LVQESINSRIGIIGMMNQRRQMKIQLELRNPLNNSVMTTKMKNGRAGRMAKISETAPIGEGFLQELYISEMDLD